MNDVNAAIQALVCRGDDDTWKKLLQEEQRDPQEIKNALLKFIPFAPSMDPLTYPVCAFVQLHPECAVDLWTKLLVFQHDLCNVSELRNWVVHAINLTQTSSTSLDDDVILAIVEACSLAIKTERRRHIAKRIHTFRATLAARVHGALPDREQSSILAHLDELAMHRGSYTTKSLVWAVDFARRYPQDRSPWSDPVVVERIKLLVCLYPELFKTMLHHWVGLKYISLSQSDNLLRHRPLLEDIMISAAHHPMLCRLESSKKHWQSQSLSVRYIDVEEPCSFSTWSSETLLSTATMDILMADMKAAAANCPPYGFDSVALALWALILHMRDHVETHRPQLFQALRLLFSSVLPADLNLEPSKLLAVLVLVAESRMGSWSLWSACPDLLTSVLVFMSKVYGDIDDEQMQWVVGMIVNCFIVQVPDIPQVLAKRAHLLPPNALQLYKQRLQLWRRA
ncbi:hypothetical protein LEN26_011924 [Aphanomyces euteiches]|nr:hypothetical protein AeMF1_018524 [Aphanomyces euteiches]KAH9118814.1 hypothetical protein LEN26_011924 [Aphanomyces euteiches]KAH9183753.1 hypothetical protein AeNC1_014270 [Aphanomyces euteiches]